MGEAGPPVAGHPVEFALIRARREPVLFAERPSRLELLKLKAPWALTPLLMLVVGVRRAFPGHSSPLACLTALPNRWGKESSPAWPIGCRSCRQPQRDDKLIHAARNRFTKMT